MDQQKAKKIRAQRRQHHVRKKIVGTPEKPRMSVYRSSKHIYVQLIDDLAGVTLLSVSSKAKGAASPYGGNVKAAKTIGQQVAEAAKSKGIAKVSFDRGPYRYHGRIKALADAAREGGLQF